MEPCPWHAAPTLSGHNLDERASSLEVVHSLTHCYIHQSESSPIQASSFLTFHGSQIAIPMLPLPWDIQDFLVGYPDAPQDPSLNDNLNFYNGTLRCRPDNKLIGEIHTQYVCAPLPRNWCILTCLDGLGGLETMISSSTSMGISNGCSLFPLRRHSSQRSNYMSDDALDSHYKKPAGTLMRRCSKSMK